MGLNLRQYQLDTLEALRKGFASGARSQILYAPTGAGKTEMAIALLEATKEKGNKAAMVLDRIILCDQTSQRLEKYGIDHGVLQAGHWRYRPYEKIQICSAQTLEKRGSFPDLNLLIVDEAHTTRSKTMEFIKNNPHIKVIGLTATPFTKGMGKSYENVVSTVTTKDLVSDKILVPLRVFIAKEIDMEGANKVAGEWSQQEATSRGMKITGDIVAEWIKKTHEIFGRPRKTIVFCSGVDHGTDLARKFSEQGYNFVSISYKDDDQFKKDAIEDFAKPDTEIHGLIATDILTKGFDVPDVMIGVSARPFSKSLSSHVQQMGRVMRGYSDKEFALWLCLAKGSRVLTDAGLVPIDKVTLNHKIWDGTNFVTHKGAICNGIQEVITYQGLTATAGHLVHTTKGWRTFGDCAVQQIRITQTGFGGTPIRISEDLRSTSFLVGRKTQEIYARFVRMCSMRIPKFNFFVKPRGREDKGVQGVQSTGYKLPDVVIQPGARHEGALLFSVKCAVSGLWRSWNRVQILWSKRRNALDYAKSWVAKIFFNSGAVTNAIRQDKSKWSLRGGQFAMAIGGVESTKQTWQSINSTNAQIQNRPSRNFVFRQYIERFLLGWNDSRTNNRKVQATIHKTKREVWDILDAGSNNCFTCEGLLVHNCHSGNYIRFQDTWEEVFESGVEELDDGKEKTRKEKTEKEKEQMKCPKCQALWSFNSDVCYNCGFVKEKLNKVVAVAGEMHELAGSMNMDDKQKFWSMCQHKVFYEGWSSGRAAHTYKDKFGVWPRSLKDVAATPDVGFEKFVKSRLIAYLKGKNRTPYKRM
jgi:late competence protein required for DNA uptake (superfamily II DNA/RNA helicase)